MGQIQQLALGSFLALSIVHRFYTHYIRLLPISLSTIYSIVTGGQSLGVPGARSIVTNHKHAQNVGWFSCHVFGTQLFQKKHLFYFHTHLLLNPLIPFTSLLVVCSAKLRGHRHLTCLEVGLLADFLTISFERSCFRRIAFINIHAFVMPKPLILLTSQLEVCRARTRNKRFGFLVRFHAISSEHSCFKRIASFIYLPM